MDDVVMTAPVTKAPAPPYHGLLGRRAWDVGIASTIRVEGSNARIRAVMVKGTQNPFSTG